MSLILLLNPKQYGVAPVIDQDTSDILDRYKRKRSTSEELLEEQIAAQILQARQSETPPEAIRTKRAAAPIRIKVEDPNLAKNKRKQLQLLLLMIAADDYE